MIGRALILGSVALLASVASCSTPPIVGDWVRKAPACADEQQDRLTIDADMTGTATLLYSCHGPGGTAVMCAANLRIAESFEGDGRWKLEANVGYCEAAGAELGRLFEECQPLSDDEYFCCDPSGKSCFDIVRA